MATEVNRSEPILSIIVPVYNVEKYLDTCLTSLVNQTVDNYEILVINDGTKDNSQEIIVMLPNILILFFPISKRTVAYPMPVTMVLKRQEVSI